MEQLAFVEGIRLLGLAATRSAAAVREELVRAIRSAAPAIDALLFFDEDEYGQLQCVMTSGPRVTYFAGVRIARHDGKTLPALALALGHRATLGADGVRGFHPADAFAVAVPLPQSGGRTSVVYAAARTTVAAETLEVIVLLADHAGFAYQLAHEREAQMRRAEYDGLTGLLAPRALREKLATLVERARYSGLARIALLFLDTDHFKTWNDTYGHASGDALLRAFARVLLAMSGPDDLVARNGGDEFCIVFTDTEKSLAVERAEALRAAIEAMETTTLCPTESAATVRITASIGVAAYPADCTTANGLLEGADEAMYHSKRMGRNAVSYSGIDGVLVCAGTAATARS